MAARLYSGLKSLNLVIDTPYDTIRTSDIRDDLIGIKVWYSTTSGFTPPGQGTLAFDGTGLNITISGPLNDSSQSLADNTTYYVKYALISSIDPDVYDISSQLTATTSTAVALLTLAPTDWAFIFDNSTAVTANYPASITFTATKQNITGTPTFTATAYNSSNTSLGSVTLTGSGDSRVLTSANFNALGATTVRYVKVIATLDTLSDTVTIWRGDNGSDALTFLLTNESHTVPADSSGNVTSYTGALTYGAIFRGITNETSLWTFTKSDGAGLTTTLTGTGTNNITLTVNSLASGTDSAVSTITATRSGYPTLTKDFSISKSKAGSQGVKGDTGDPGGTGLEGIRSITAYRVRNQSDAALTTAPSNTSGATAPTGYQLTASAVIVGEVLWYSFGRYNPNNTTVESIPANTTVWSVPVAASIFQDIRSDNYNGPNPPTTTNYGTSGYYLERSTGNLYGSNVYLRGSLSTAPTGRRVEVNVSSSNKLIAYNAGNTALVEVGGTGTDADALLITRPQATSGYAYGQSNYIPNVYNTYAGGSQQFATAVYSRDSGFWTVGRLSTYYLGAGASSYAYAVGGAQSSPSVPTDSASGYLGYWDASGITTAGLFRSNGNAGSATYAQLYLCESSTGYAVRILNGTFRYQEVTIAVPPNNSTTYLRGDGTWQNTSHFVKNGSVATNLIEIRWSGTKAQLYIDNTYISNGFEASSTGGVSNAYANITDGTTTAAASASDTFKFRAGTGVSVTVGSNDATHGDNVLITNTGVTSLTGTSNQVSVSASTGGVTLSLPQSIATSSNVQFNRLGVGIAQQGIDGRIDASNDIVSYSSSDRNLKTNIQPIVDPISKIFKLSGNTFDWQPELEHLHGYSGSDLGVIAQEVEDIFPQAVRTNTNGYKSVRYEKLIPLLIEAVKAQQEQINRLVKLIEEK